jgi:glycosyltransferase involved in cell wall biosynthesis
MKVGFLLNRNVFYESSASANRWKNIITGLSNNGVKSVLYVVGGFQFRIEKEKVFKEECCDIIYLDSNVYNGIWKNRIKAYFLGPIITYLQAKKLKRIIAKENLNYLFLNDANEVLKVYDLAFKEKCPSFKLLFEMNEDPDSMAVHATNFLQKKKLKEQKQLLQKRIFKEIDFIFFITNSLIDKYSKGVNGFNQNVYLLPMSVDMARFENLEKESQEEYYIAYCGSSSFHKDGVDILIKAFDILAKRHSEIKLKIAAFWENDGSKMKALINNSESKRIEYLGELSKDEIPQFIKNASILVLPRPNSEQSNFGFPTKLGEYLATGNPVCCTKVGEIDNYLVDHYSVFFADPGSVNSLVSTIEYIILNPNKAKEVGINGRLVAYEHFDKEKQGAFLKGILIDNQKF